MPGFDTSEFDIATFDINSDKGIVYSPRLKAPLGGEIFNFGEVNVAWDINDPPTSISSFVPANLHYELEYTDNYRGDQTKVSGIG